MILVLGFQLMRSSSTASPATVPTEVSSDFPRLLALESTEIPRQATNTPVPLMLTPTSGATLFVANVPISPTPLVLLHDQQPDIIGYSVEGRPLDVYTFGNGEHQRMIV